MLVQDFTYLLVGNTKAGSNTVTARPGSVVSVLQPAGCYSSVDTIRLLLGPVDVLVPVDGSKLWYFD
jgi:hypothetical protein